VAQKGSYLSAAIHEKLLGVAGAQELQELQTIVLLAPFFGLR